MQTRTIVTITPSGNRTENILPDEDVALYIQHLEDTRSVNLVMVDRVVVNTGLFDLGTIRKYVTVEKQPTSPRKKGTKKA